MKHFPALICIAIVALVLPACAAKKKETASCCAAKGSCETPVKKHKH